MTPPDSSGNIGIGGSFNTIMVRMLAGCTTQYDDRRDRFDFNAGGAGFSSGTIYALPQAPDGKYYAGGSYSSYKGVSRRGGCSPQ